MSEISRCGYVAIIGRPNVGKSTLLNRLIGQKISITSRKPQTTRHRILGIRTDGDTQTIFVDTPGLHQSEKHALNRYMNRTADSVIHDVDVLIFVVDAKLWTEEDEWILKKLKNVNYPVILALNKVDKILEKETLLPLLNEYSAKMSFVDIVPLSAKIGQNVDVLQQCVEKLLPENPHFFADEQITDRNERFLAAELIREKIIRQVGEEVPHAMTVQIEEFVQKGKVLHISAIIWVEREGQKIIIIGKEGQRLKETGKLARLAMQKLFQQKVFLRVWVKVKEGWSDDVRALQSLGYDEL